MVGPNRLGKASERRDSFVTSGSTTEIRVPVRFIGEGRRNIDVGTEGMASVDRPRVTNFSSRTSFETACSLGRKGHEPRALVPEPRFAPT